MLPLPLIPGLATLKIAAMVALLAFGGGYLKGCTDEAARTASFKAAVAAVGEAQEARTRERIALDKQRKEKSDEENRRSRARAVADARRVSDLVAGFSLLPAPGPGAASPDRICFDPAGFDAAIRGFLQETAGIAVEGNQAVIDLDTARRWAQGR